MPPDKKVMNVKNSGSGTPRSLLEDHSYTENQPFNDHECFFFFRIHQASCDCEPERPAEYSGESESHALLTQSKHRHRLIGCRDQALDARLLSTTDRVQSYLKSGDLQDLDLEYTSLQ